MDRDRSHEFMCKSAAIERSTVTDADLAAINRFALRELTADEVFTFRVVLCDNAVDRTFDRFSDAALADLAALYIGKTVIKDHSRKADGQIARIYATELSAADDDGYRQLKANCYMVRTETNADLIREIEGGIKREGSVSFMPKSYVCGICGADNMRNYCTHWGGVSYAKDGKEEVCVFTIEGVSDCYEFSLVAVPAQREAGVCKGYKAALKPPESIPAPDEGEPRAKDACAALRERLTAARIRAAENKNK